jgi:hypothetical protein
MRLAGTSKEKGGLLACVQALPGLYRPAHDESPAGAVPSLIASIPFLQRLEYDFPLISLPSGPLQMLIEPAVKKPMCGGNYLTMFSEPNFLTTDPEGNRDGGYNLAHQVRIGGLNRYSQPGN